MNFWSSGFEKKILPHQIAIFPVFISHTPYQHAGKVKNEQPYAGLTLDATQIVTSL